VRLRVPTRRHDHEFFTRVVAALRPLVAELHVNPATASLLIEDPEEVALDAVLEFARTHGLFEAPNGGVLRLAESVVHGARQFDRTVRRVSGGQLDLRALAFLSLLGGALYQLLRGELLAPAATLGWYAAAVLALPAAGEPKEVIK
jgi:hypothetical protein